MKEKRSELEQKIKRLKGAALDHARLAYSLMEEAKSLQKILKEMPREEDEQYHGDELGEWGARRLKAGILKMIR